MFVRGVAKYVGEYLARMMSSYGKERGEGKEMKSVRWEQSPTYEHHGRELYEITYKGSQILNDGNIFIPCSQQNMFIARHDGKYD